MTRAAVDDPAERLATLLLTLQHTTQRDADTLRATERNRFSLLIVHAIAATVIAPLFILSGPTLLGPNWVYLSLIPGFPITFGLLFWSGGLILLPAAILKRRRWEMSGLWILSMWYAILAIGFAIPVGVWVYHLLAGTPPPGSLRPNFYAWLVYLHLAVIMRVHWFTLLKIGRNDRLRANETLDETST